MRLLAFTLLAVAISAAIQLGLDELPNSLSNAMHGIYAVLFVLLPVLATAGLAYAMRISNLGYVIVLAVLAPFVSWISTVFIAVFVLGQPAYRWIL